MGVPEADMADASHDKISADLAQRLETADPREAIEVVVELQPPAAKPVAGSKAERTAAARRSFDQTLANISGPIAPEHGKILESAWINSTVKALLTRDEIHDLERNEQVRRIDSPRAISAEA
jgi:hypothetical protein